MPDIKVLTSAKLEEMIHETEVLLARLKAELERRRNLAQTQEINRLEKHLDESEFSLATLKDFIDYLLRQMR